MYTHIVHVMRKEVTEFILGTNLEGERNREYRYFNSFNARVDGGIDSNRPSEMETWYARNAVEANALARRLAADVPGREVCVYALATQFLAPPGVPVQSEYSERGLLPV